MHVAGSTTKMRAFDWAIWKLYFPAMGESAEDLFKNPARNTAKATTQANVRHGFQPLVVVSPMRMSTVEDVTAPSGVI